MVRITNYRVNAVTDGVVESSLVCGNSLLWAESEKLTTLHEPITCSRCMKD
jgi:hypothetical protein